MLKGKKISIIGGGKMGEVLAKGITANKLVPAADVLVADVLKQRLHHLKGKYGVAVTENNLQAVKAADIVILAVKPQSMAEVCTTSAAKSRWPPRVALAVIALPRCSSWCRTHS